MVVKDICSQIKEQSKELQKDKEILGEERDEITEKLESFERSVDQSQN